MRNISDETELRRDVASLRATLKELGQVCSLRDPIAMAVEAMQFTPAQVHTLLWLGEGAATMGELARRVGITEKTITGVVDRLERAGLVTRERDGADRRVVHVKLTRKGTHSHQKLQTSLESKLSQLLALLDRADREALQSLLRKLIGRLKGASGEVEP